MLCYVMLCYVMLRCDVPCCVPLCYVMVCGMRRSRHQRQRTINTQSAFWIDCAFGCGTCCLGCGTVLPKLRRTAAMDIWRAADRAGARALELRRARFVLGAWRACARAGAALALSRARALAIVACCARSLLLRGHAGCPSACAEVYSARSSRVGRSKPRSGQLGATCRGLMHVGAVPTVGTGSTQPSSPLGWGGLVVRPAACRLSSYNASHCCCEPAGCRAPRRATAAVLTLSAARGRQFVLQYMFGDM